MCLKHAILRRLGDSRYYSGEYLAAEFGVTRTAIWKAMRMLAKHYGLQIDAVKGKGYRLVAPLNMLAKEVISAEMQRADNISNIEILLSVDSTNRFVMGLVAKNCQTGTVVFAEHQSNGRGRQGRQWISPFGENLYFSLLWRFDQSAAASTGLSVAVAIGVARALNKLGVTDLEIKWPNDIMCQGRKLAGILLEMHGEVSGPYAVVIGVGINIRMSSSAAQSIDQPWIDLSQTQASDISRNKVAAIVLDEIVLVLSQFAQYGLTTFMNEWQTYDRLFEKPVVLELSDKTISGVARGIDASGALLLEQPQGIVRFFSGDVRLRKGENQ